jgi:hypothetical protein
MKRLKEVLLYFVSRIFCLHDEELVNQFEVMSEFDIVVSNGKVPIPWDSKTRIVVTDYKCKKCGKFKRRKVFTHS